MCIRDSPVTQPGATTANAGGPSGGQGKGKKVAKLVWPDMSPKQRAEKSETKAQAPREALKPGAVSYTHLDVYKRQRLHMMPSVMPFSISHISVPPKVPTLRLRIMTALFWWAHTILPRIWWRCFPLM